MINAGGVQSFGYTIMDGATTIKLKQSSFDLYLVEEDPNAALKQTGNSDKSNPAANTQSKISGPGE